MIYHYKNSQKITAVWRSHYGMICCHADDDQHANLSVANGSDEQLLPYGDAGFQCLGIISAFKAIGQRRTYPVKRIRFWKIKLIIKIPFFQRKILLFLYSLRKKRHLKRTKSGSKPKIT